MKKLLGLVLILALATAAGLVAIPAFAATRTVSLKDNFFTPKSLSIKRGTTVIFRWRGTAPHNVTVTSGPKRFHSRTQTRGSFKATPHTKGTYHIVCTIHAGMAMTLKVR